MRKGFKWLRQFRGGWDYELRWVVRDIGWLCWGWRWVPCQQWWGKEKWMIANWGDWLKKYFHKGNRKNNQWVKFKSRGHRKLNRDEYPILRYHHLYDILKNRSRLQQWFRKAWIHFFFLSMKNDEADLLGLLMDQYKKIPSSPLLQPGLKPVKAGIKKRLSPRIFTKSCRPNQVIHTECGEYRGYLPHICGD